MQNIHNFRDIGGFPVAGGMAIKKGLLYRSGSLSEASGQDLEELAALGIRSVIDLRTNKEKDQAPDRLPEGRHLTYLHLPVTVSKRFEDSRMRMLLSLMFGRGRRADFHALTVQSYRSFVTDYRVEFGRVLSLAGDAGSLPMLIHCTAGKDRTGFAASLIQLLLGADPQAAMQDYLASNDLLRTYQQEMQHRMKSLPRLGISLEKFLPLFEARPEYLQAAWDQIQQEYGSREAYFKQGLGLSDDGQQSLRRLLLET
jgi:protein-tyrosine phosphatase